MTEAMKFKKATYHLYTFLTSKIVGTLGANVYTFAISMYILAITGSSLSFATNMLLSILPRTVMAPIAGILADRLPRKWLVLGGQLGQIVVINGLLLYTVNVELSLSAIYLATVLNSLFGTFTSVAFAASVSNLVDESRIQKAMSFNQLSYSISGIGGPIVGGIMYGFVAMETFLLLYIGAMIVTFILEATMNFTLYHKEQAVEAKQETMLESFKEGIRYVKGQPVLKAVFLAALWLNFFFSSINVGGDFVLVTIFDMKPQWIGFIEAGGAIGMLFAAILFASRSTVKMPLLFVKRSTMGMAIAVMLAAVPLVIPMSITGQFLYYFLLMFSFSVLAVTTNTPLGVLLQTTIDEEYKGRVFGIVEMMAMSMMPLGTLMYGFLFDLFPASIVFIGSGLCLIGINLLLLHKEIIALAHPEILEKENEDKWQDGESIYSKKHTFMHYNQRYDKSLR